MRFALCCWFILLELTKCWLQVLFAGSARGLSLSAYVLETLAYAITLVYSYRNEFPFSTYGENFFLTLQNSVITTLIVYFPSTALKSGRSNVGGAFVTVLALLAGAALLLVTPAPTLSLLQAATVPLGVLSKLPQITANYRARSTGQLSVVAVGSQIAGCLARLFTTATEVGDTMLFLGFAVALVLNCVLGAQMWMYWNADRDDVEMDMGRVQVGEKGKEWARSGQVDIVIPPGTPTAPTSNTPSGRRWSRKVD